MSDSHFFRYIYVGVGGPIIGLLGSAVFSEPNLKVASIALGTLAALLTCVVKSIELYRKLKNYK